MSEGRFHLWLLAQVHRGDRVGDLARDMRHGGLYLEGHTYDEVRRHMEAVGASTAALRALNAAKQEWDAL